MKRKIFTYIAVIIMVLTAFFPVITSSKEIQSFRDKSNVDQIKERIRPLVETLKKRTTRPVVFYNGRPSIHRTGVISRYLYLYLRYGDIERWVGIDRLSYLLNKIKGERGISIDVDNDGSNDVSIDFRFIPKIIKKPRIAIAYDTTLIVKKLSTCSLSQPKSFETKMYFYLPKIFSEKLISIGYLSPLGHYIPELCKVHHLFVPNLIRYRSSNTYMSLEYISTDPSPKIVMLSGEGGGNSSTWTSVESGHISIGGAVKAKVDGVFEVNGEEIKLSGTFYLDTKTDTVDIWWNTTRGYFKINGSGHFKVKDIHFDADDKIVFDAESMVVDGDGYVEIDQSGESGDLSLDAVGELKGLTFDIDVSKNKTEFSGTFELSANSLLNNFRLSWGDSGFSADGSFDGKIALNITNFHLRYGNFTVNAGKLSLVASLSLEFIKNGEVVICTISSAGASISDLYMKYDGHATTVDHIDVDGTLTINLEMTIIGREYVTAEQGHMSISGDNRMNISVTADINGTEVVLIGVFTLDTKTDTVDIWWNTTRGYFKINGSSHFSVDKFFISIEKFGVITIERLALDAGGSLIINQSGKSGDALIDGRFDLSGLKISLDSNGKHLIAKGSFDFSIDADGWIEIKWDEGNFSIDGNLTASSNAYLSIKDLYVNYGDLTVSADRIDLGGFAGFKFIRGTLSLSSPETGLKIENMYIKYGKEFTVSLGELFLNGSGSFVLSKPLLALNAQLAIKLEDLQVSASSYGSLNIGYLSSKGDGSITIANYFEAQVGGRITINSMRASATGFYLGLSSLNAGGSAYLYFDSHTKITAGGSVTITGLNVRASGASLSVGYLSAGGSLDLYMGGYTSISAGGSLVIVSLSGRASGVSLSLDSLQVHGSGYLYLGSYTELSASAGLSLYSLHTKGSINLGIEQITTSGKANLIMRDSSIEANASASLHLKQFNFTYRETMLGFDSLDVNAGAIIIGSRSTGYSISGDGSVSLRNTYMNLYSKEGKLSGKISSLDFSGEAKFIIYNNGVDVSCTMSFNMGESTFAYEDIIIDIDTIMISGGGSLFVKPTEDGAEFSTYGTVVWNIESNVLTTRGDVDGKIDGAISDSGEGVDLHISSRGVHAPYIYLSALDMAEFEIRNFYAPSGDLIIKLSKTHIYLDNQVNMNWDYLAFNLAGTIYGTIGKFRGDADILTSGNRIRMNSYKGFTLMGAISIIGIININYLNIDPGTSLDLYIDADISPLLPPDYLHVEVDTGGGSIDADVSEGSIHIMCDNLMADNFVFIFDNSHPLDYVWQGSLTGTINIWINGIQVFPPSWLTSENVTLEARIKGDNEWQNKKISASSGQVIEFKATLLTDNDNRDALQSLSSYLYTFYWGDGNTTSITSEDTTIIEEHVYNKPGSYTVTVSVRDAENQSKFFGSALMSVDIDSLDIKLIASPMTADVGETVYFTAKINYNNNQHDNRVTSLNSDGGRYEYTFSFGDWAINTTYSDDKTVTVTHEYNESGIYMIYVFVTDKETGRSGASSTIVRVGGGRLKVTLEADDTTVDVDQTVHFTIKIEYKSDEMEEQNDGGNLVRTLDGGNDYRYVVNLSFGDGKWFNTSTSETLIPTEHIYSKKGDYLVFVKVHDTETDSTSSSNIVKITVGSDRHLEAWLYAKKEDGLIWHSRILCMGQYPTKVSFKAEVKESNNNNYDQSQVTSLSGSGRYRYNFSFGDGTTFEDYSDSTTYITSHTLDRGIYLTSVTITDTSTNREDTGTMRIIVGYGAIDILVTLKKLSSNYIEVTADVTNDNSYAYNMVTSLSPQHQYKYIFDFGDGTVEERDGNAELSITHEYSEGGRYIINVTVYNTETSAFGSRSTTVSIGEVKLEPVILLSKSSNIASEENNYRITFDVSRSYDPDNGDIPGSGIVGIRWKYNGKWNTPTGRWVSFDAHKTFICDFSDEVENLGSNDHVSSLSDTGNQHTSGKIIFVTIEIKDDDGQISSGTTQIFVKYPTNTTNHAPVAKINGPYSVNEDDDPTLTVTFYATGSYDPDGDNIEYRWQISGYGINVDSGWITSETFEHSFKDDLSQVTSLANGEISNHRDRIMGKFVEKLIKILEKIFGDNSRIVNLLSEVGSHQGEPSLITKIFTVKLTIKDDKGKISSNRTTLSIEYHQNQPPVARISGPSSGKVGQSLTFSASQSYDPDGDSLKFRWDFNGDGVWNTDWSFSSSKSHTYSSAGTYTVRVQVKDIHGATNTASKTVTITSSQNQKPVAIVTGPTSGIKGNTYTFYGNNSYDPDGDVVAHAWQIYKEGTCFLAGTKILMADGSVKNIEDIKKGDMVKAYDEVTGKLVSAKVTKVYHHSRNEMTSHYLVINGLLKITPEHIIYVNGAWKSAEKIKIGDKLYTFDGREIEVKEIKKVYRKVETFNIEVENYHNFYANGILVHNKVGGGSVISWHNGKPTTKSYTFSNTGTYAVRLYVKDNNGATDYDTLEITITDGNNG